MAPPKDNEDFPGIQSGVDRIDPELETQLYARKAEIDNLNDLAGTQRGTPIPALFNQFYKFIQNPSSVSVETFKRMVDTDDTIGSGVDFLTTCLAARIGRYQHKSEEITEWVNSSLEKIRGGWFNSTKELLSASWAGFCVMEKVWANTDHGFIIDKLVALPPVTVLFETDRTGEITDDGILQYQRNYNPLVLNHGTGFFGGPLSASQGFNTVSSRPDVFAKLGDLPFPLRTANTYNYLSIRIPKLKCVHYAFDAQGKFGNPYGRSLLRRAYKYYVMKDAFLQMLSVALDRKGTPLTIVYCDPNTSLIDPDKNTGTAGARGRDVGIRADVAARNAFEKIHNDTVIFLPGKKDQIFGTEFVPQDSNSEAFISAINLCNKGMMRALLIPALIFGDGDGSGSFALAETHARTFDKILDGMTAGMKQVLLDQVIKEEIAYNFPESAWKKDGFGDFGKRDMSLQERQAEAEMYDRAIHNGTVDVDDLNDLNKMRDTLGFEPRDTPIERDIPFDEDFSETNAAPPIRGEKKEKPNKEREEQGEGLNA